MKAKKYWILAGLLLVATVVVCVASTLTEEQQQLQGINAVKVSVILTEKMPKDNLLKSKIQTDVELKLRSYGLKVVPEDEIVSFAPRLTISIASVPVHYEQVNVTLGYASAISVGLRDYVQVLRNENIISAPTWERDFVKYSPYDIFTEDVRGTVSDSIDKFINDYLAANPKTAPTTTGKLSFEDISAKFLVKCGNPDCGAEYQIDQRDYFEYMKEHQKGLVRPPMVCEKCGEESVFRAEKCEKCGAVFFYEAVADDLPDRCTECGYSKTEKLRGEVKANKDKKPKDEQNQ